MYTYLSSSWLQENDATHPTYLSGPMDTQKSRYSSPVDHRSLDDLWPQITIWSLHKYIHNVTKVMCALSVLQKECRKVWGARYTLGARYRSENTVHVDKCTWCILSSVCTGMLLVEITVSYFLVIYHLVTVNGNPPQYVALACKINSIHPIHPWLILHTQTASSHIFVRISFYFKN